MKPLNVLFLFTAVFLLCTNSALAQNEPNPEDYDIAKCKTLEEVNAAKAAGREFIELRGSYMFKIGNEYKGLFPSFRRAFEERERLGGPSVNKDEPTAMKGRTYFNPLSIIYPFTQLADDKKTPMFEIPGGTLINADQVMLHVEPYSFDSISFGLLNFRQRGMYFAVTGGFYAEDIVKDATGQLEYSVGSAVVSKNGDVLWKHYGIVDEMQGFRVIEKLENIQSQPEFLLVFLLAKGKLEKQLSRLENPPQIDAAPFEYHVLSSSALLMGKDWFPPLDDVMKEEYLKLYREEQQKNKRSPITPILPSEN